MAVEVLPELEVFPELEVLPEPDVFPEPEVLPEPDVFPELEVLPAAVLAASKRDFWVTPVAFAIFFRASLDGTAKSRSALLMSLADRPTSSASFAWVKPAAVRASLMSAPNDLTAIWVPPW